MNHRIAASLFVVVSSLLQAGCAFGIAGPHPAGPIVHGPRHPQPLTRDQAVSRGQSYCRSQGYECRLKEANLAKHDSIWKVKFDARGRRAKGKVHLDIDAFTGEVVRADEKGKLRHHG